MEITTEINKYFGQEIAKHVADSISEEELIKAARNAWDEVATAKCTWESPPIVKLAREEFLDRLKEEVEKIALTEEFSKQLAEEAPKIVDEIISETKRKMVEEISGRMAALGTGYHGVGINTMIDEFLRMSLTSNR